MSSSPCTAFICFSGKALISQSNETSSRSMRKSFSDRNRSTMCPTETLLLRNAPSTIVSSCFLICSIRARVFFAGMFSMISHRFFQYSLNTSIRSRKKLADSDPTMIRLMASSWDCRTGLSSPERALSEFTNGHVCTMNRPVLCVMTRIVSICSTVALLTNFTNDLRICSNISRLWSVSGRTCCKTSSKRQNQT
uniref:(northern house mosquito) hypothetical protein n=1 Tax=Culex pipiens TaxID=7175 RepID=A0A8D7ZWU9_CULPI